ncbi:MAG: opacity family porin [Ahrensia sp.]|nr:opacity family porin [Ahrensia sp.]
MHGSSDWRFAYALMAGASYAVNKNFSLDVGYRYKKIQGGHMFG